MASMLTPPLACTRSVGVCAAPPTDACAAGRPDAHLFCALATFDLPLHVEHVRAVVRDRLLPAHPRLRAVPDRSQPAAPDRWTEDPGFDLDLHVHRRALGAPGDRHALRELVAQVATAIPPGNRPPWDLVCVDGYRSGGALVARLDRRLVHDAKRFVDTLAEQLGGRREPVEGCPALAVLPGRRRG